MQVPRILTIILAGGTGGRLGPLTDHRAKPAMPVAGSYRLIDIALSNLHNSGMTDVWIVEQYKPKSLNDHLVSGRPWDLDRTNGGLRVLPPYQGGEGEGFAEGNADALYRQAGYIREYDPDLVLVLSADHLYTMDFRDVVATHHDAGAALTVVTTKIRNNPSDHGVVQVDGGTVTGFEYKPEQPKTDLVAAEIFLYDAGVLLTAMDDLVEREGQLEDYGDQLIPYLVQTEKVAEHRLEGYWRDMGTPRSYHQGHMDLIDGHGLDFDNPQWPILSAAPRRLPGFAGETAKVSSSLLAPGSRVEGTIHRSVLGPGAVVEAGAEVDSCVILGDVRISSGAKLRNAIVDAGAVIGGGTSLDGAELDPDAGVVVIGADGALGTPPSS
ncbi:NTP transferase domain-containing protein [Arthrobacter sp. zg-ZUI100]|uniref:glucose-1-phosphate adenylyltransferase family protein n=1 Tax=Arthrobacter jiangjiafuii TaxID=2817475 RepID=UPI001AEDD05F|nr:sugar phosphate nucleotidyltransferase [Arthrobacter jiangjiafuii]MBP3035351.1 NTP transferase domain-containing protein [Arthrobacter jiangjiafuii]